MTRRVSVAILEDDNVQLSYVCSQLERVSDFETIWTAGSLSQAEDRLSVLPDVLLCDLELPDGLSFDLISKFSSQTKVIVITIFGDEASTLQAISAGAAGYLLKGASGPDIESSIRSILNGEAPISAAVAAHLLKKFQPCTPESNLTPRELEVLELLARGNRYKEIAADLGCSYHTVAQHVRNIYEKLAVNSRGEAIYKASRTGVLPPVSP